VALSTGIRAKHAEAAAKVLPDTEVLGYVAGRAGPDPTQVIIGLFVLWCVGAVAFYVVTGGIFILGVIPILLVNHVVSPPRGLVVSDETAVLLARSLWTGRPRSVVATVDRRQVEPVKAAGSRIKVTVGAEHHIWLSKGEENELRTAMARAASHLRSPKLDIGPPPDIDSDDPLEGPLPGPPPPAPETD
jgi:hypothetical protein